MSKLLRIAGIVSLPLALGACGLPIGVQIASLFADGVSYMTTEKTLTDHGISAVTDKDCALWRSVEGKDICRESSAEETVQTALAINAPPVDERIETSAFVEAGGDSDLPMELSAPQPQIPPRSTQAAEATTQTNAPSQREESQLIAGVTQPVVKSPSEDNPEAVEKMILDDVAPVRADNTLNVRRKIEKPAPEIQIAEIPAAPTLSVALPPVPSSVRTEPKSAPPEMIDVAATSVSKEDAQPAETFFIIASYHRAADASRFSDKHTKYGTQVLEGTAKGKRVFRVAVGPIERPKRPAMRKHLKSAGFEDTWRLTLDEPKVVTEVASAAR